MVIPSRSGGSVRRQRAMTRTANPSTGRELRQNRKLQKIAGKRVWKILGAGGRRFESGRPDHFPQVHSEDMGNE